MQVHTKIIRWLASFYAKFNKSAETTQKKGPSYRSNRYNNNQNYHNGKQTGNYFRDEVVTPKPDKH